MSFVEELLARSAWRRMAVANPSVRHDGKLLVASRSSSRYDAFCAHGMAKVSKV
jgi:hypothetical protein|eukprot:COSAG02_NODE_1604_length_11728_cov_42.819417_10_plen_54_part_00